MGLSLERKREGGGASYYEHTKGEERKDRMQGERKGLGALLLQEEREKELVDGGGGGGGRGGGGAGGRALFFAVASALLVAHAL